MMTPIDEVIHCVVRTGLVNYPETVYKLNTEDVIPEVIDDETIIERLS